MDNSLELAVVLVLSVITNMFSYLAGLHDGVKRNRYIGWNDLSDKQREKIIDNGGVDENGVRWI